MEDSEYILEGTRVLDMSTFVTGGFCSLMLANQGADVIKIERPGVGDDIRHSGPPFIEGESPYYWTVNYDKRSVEVDLKTHGGREVVYDLAASADVFIQNFRPGTAERLGVEYDRITEENDEIIYCDISAFGDSGPWRQRPGYDLLVQGLSGIMAVTGEKEGGPVKVGLPMTDLITGMWAAFGIVTSLYRREETGEGEYFDLGMLDATLPWLTKQAGRVFADETPERMGTTDPVLAPYQTYRTADGQLNVACLNPKLWQEFCRAIDREELTEDKRFETNADRVESRGALESEIERTLTDRTTEEWLELFTERGIPAAPVHGIEEALYNEQTDAREAVGTISDGASGEEGKGSERGEDEREIPVIEHPFNFRHATSGFRRPPPQLGEHTREVLSEIGYDNAKVERLFEDGAIGTESD